MICDHCYIDKEEKEFYHSIRENPHEENISKTCRQCVQNNIDNKELIDKCMQELNLYFFDDIWTHYYKTKKQFALNYYVTRMCLGNLNYFRYNDILKECRLLENW